MPFASHFAIGVATIIMIIRVTVNDTVNDNTIANSAWYSKAVDTAAL